MFLSTLRGRLLALLVLWCPLAMHAQAPDLIQISGIVRDSAGVEPIIGATVMGNDGETATITNFEGKFLLKVQRLDRIHIRVTYIGYDTVHWYKNNPKESFYELNLRLPEETISLGEVVVSGSKSEQKAERLTVSVETMRPAAIDRQASADITRSLEMTTGITFTQGQISIRGSSGFAQGTGSRVVVLQDGLPMMSAEAGDAKFEMLPTDNIRSIEIIKGSSSVLYGSGGLGGVINIISAEPTTKPKTSIRLRGQIFDRPANHRNIWTSFGAPYGVSGHVFHSRKIGIMDFVAHGDIIRESGYRQYEGTLRGRVFTQFKFYSKAKPGLSYGFSTFYMFDSSGFFLGWRAGFNYREGGMLQPSISRVTGLPDVVRTANHYMAVDPFVSYVTQKGNRHLYRGRVFSTWNLGPNKSQNATGIMAYNEYQYIHRFKLKRPGYRVQLISGINYTFSTAISDSIYSFTADSLDKWGGRNKIANSIAPFVQADLTLGPRITLNLGFRYQFDLINRVIVLSEPIGRVGINVRVAEGTFVRGSYGMGVRNPSIRERFIQTVQYGLNVTPNPDIKIERGFSAEIGVKQYFKMGGFRGQLDAAGFFMRFENMIEYLFETGRVSAQNISLGYIPGAEVSLAFQGKVRKVGIEGNVGYTFIWPFDPGGDPNLDGDNLLPNGQPDFNVYAPLLPSGTTPGKPDRPRTLKYRSRHMVRGTLVVDWKGFSLTNIVRFNSTLINIDKLFALTTAPGSLQYRRDNPNDFVVWDIVFAKEVKINTFSFHVFNLLNREYMTFPGILGQQRSFAVQYKLSI
jgi:iron complex outermembrane receptor protein